MADPFPSSFDSQADENPLPGHKKMSSNEQWVFGSIFAALLLTGFAFGVVAGASRPKVIEVAEKKEPERVAMGPAPKPTPQPQPKPKEPTPEPKKAPEPEPKPKEPDAEPKPKEATPEPKPKDTPPEPKKGPEPKKFEGTPVSFKEVVPILRSYCWDCHGSPKKDDNLDLRTIESIMKGGDSGKALIPGDPANSAIYESIVERRMPKGKKGPNDKEMKLLHDWIASGAKSRRTVRRRKR